MNNSISHKEIINHFRLEKELQRILVLSWATRSHANAVD